MSIKSKEDILNVWKNARWKDRKFCLYIDNPFCIKKCKFCIYKSTSIDTPEIYNKYYNEYVPRCLDDFREILESRQIDTLYFGGGTGSLMSPDILRNILERIPRCKNIKTKVLECSPATLTRKKIDILGEYGFSYITVGIQTLDSDELRRQNRDKINEGLFVENIKYAKSKNLIVSFDLMAFLNNASVIDDIDRLENDIISVVKTYSPDIIDIYPMQQSLHSSKRFKNIKTTSEEDKEDLSKIVRLYRMLIKCSRRIGYTLITSRGSIADKDCSIGGLLGNFYLSKLNEHDFSALKQYCSSGASNLPTDQNTLSIGGYGKRSTYSYIGGDYYYLCVNDNWDTVYKSQEVMED